MDTPSPPRWVTGGLTSRALLHPPLHPSFYSKALTVTWGLAPASPQPLAPQRPGIDRATGHGLGPGLGRPCRQRPGHPPPPHPSPVAYATLAWGPVNRRSAERRPFLVKSRRCGGCPRSPPLAAGPSPRAPWFCDRPNLFLVFKGKLLKKATFIIVSTGQFFLFPPAPPTPEPVSPPDVSGPPLLRGVAGEPRAGWPRPHPSIVGRALSENNPCKLNRELECPG